MFQFIMQYIKCLSLASKVFNSFCLLQSFYTKIVHKYKGLEANTKIFRPKFIVCRLKTFLTSLLAVFPVLFEYDLFTITYVC